MSTSEIDEGAPGHAGRDPLVPERFELLAPPQPGSGATVLAARETRTGRVVRIRRAPRPVDAAFERRARSAMALDDPCIARVFEVGVHGGVPYAIAESIDGELLERRLANGSTGLRKSLGLLRAVAEAIDRAHGRGIVHGTLHPGLVLVTREGGPKILDFGFGEPGPPGYLAPEQLAGGSGRSTPAADIHALGAVLHRVLTGLPPRPRVRLGSGYERWTDPLPPRRLDPRISPGLEAIVLRAMSGDPAARFPTAGAFAEELGARQDWPGETNRVTRLRSLIERFRGRG